MGVIWGKREGEYFWREDWTAGISLIRFNKLPCARRLMRDCSHTRRFQPSGLRWLNGTLRKHRGRHRQNRPLQVLLHPAPAAAAFRRDRKKRRLRQ